MHLLIKKFLVVLSFVFSLAAQSQGFLKASGSKIVNEKGENILLRGIGLGGWMLQEGYMLRVNDEGRQSKIRERITDLIGEGKTEAFYNAWLSNHTRKIDIDSLRAWGFNSVRLPMHYNLYTLAAEEEPVKGENTWLQKGFQLTDSLLAWCKANQMYLILDLHAAPGGQGNDLNISDRDPSKPSLWESEANKQKMIALWKKLAQRYANEPWIGGYDIINEPNWGFEEPANDKNGLKEKTNAPLRQLMMDITKAIREVDVNHMIIIEGNGWGNNYNGILPTWDNNIVLSFHKYWNFNDRTSIQHIIDTREKYQVPVWLGETGENSNVWFTDAVQLLESNNIGWAWWPLKKLGNNNPMQIASNPDYEKILRYWNDKGSKPSEQEAYKGLMQFANDTKLENTTIKRDVIDALFRQPHTFATIPFRQIKITAGTIVNAVDYDLGRNGFAYYDLDSANYHVSTGKRTAGNRGNVYRNDGVDIAKDSSRKNSYYATSIEDGEWLQYTLNVITEGNYTLIFRCFNAGQEGQFEVSVNNQTYKASVAVKTTGVQNIEIRNVRLRKGENVLQFTAKKGGFDFRSIQFLHEKR